MAVDSNFGATQTHDMPGAGDLGGSYLLKWYIGHQLVDSHVVADGTNFMPSPVPGDCKLVVTVPGLAHGGKGPDGSGHWELIVKAGSQVAFMTDGLGKAKLSVSAPYPANAAMHILGFKPPAPQPNPWHTQECIFIGGPLRGQLMAIAAGSTAYQYVHPKKGLPGGSIVGDTITMYVEIGLLMFKPTWGNGEAIPVGKAHHTRPNLRIFATSKDLPETRRIAMLAQALTAADYPTDGVAVGDVPGPHITSHLQLVEVVSSKSKFMAQYMPQAYAKGGLVTGPGSGTSDSIPAMISPGETIVHYSPGSGIHALLESQAKMLQELNKAPAIKEEYEKFSGFDSILGVLDEISVLEKEVHQSPLKKLATKALAEWEAKKAAAKGQVFGQGEPVVGQIVTGYNGEALGFVTSVEDGGMTAQVMQSGTVKLPGSGQTVSLNSGDSFGLAPVKVSLHTDNPAPESYATWAKQGGKVTLSGQIGTAWDQPNADPLKDIQEAMKQIKMGKFMTQPIVMTSLQVEALAKQLKPSFGSVNPPGPAGMNSIFGSPIVIDDELPPNVIKIGGKQVSMTPVADDGDDEDDPIEDDSYWLDEDE